MTSAGAPSTAGGLRRLSASTLIVALLGYLTLVVAARMLGPDDYAGFAVLWGVYFAATGLLFGLQQEVTRSVAGSSQDADRLGTPVVAWVLMADLILVALVVSTIFWWVPDLDTSRLWIAAAMVLALTSLGVQSTIVGALAGTSHWDLLAWIATVSAVTRTAAVVVLVGIGVSDAWLVLAIGSGSLAWVILLRSSRVVAALRVRTTDGAGTFLRRSAAVVISSGCAALLAPGFPVLLSLWSPEALAEGAGVFLAALVLVRTPLLLPLNAFQLVLLTRFTRSRDHLLAALAPVLGILVVAGAVATLSAAVLGPPVLQLLFGSAYQLGGAEMAGLAAGTVALALLTVTGTALLARSQHRESTYGWVIAVAATCLALSMSGSVEVRGIRGLVLGPLAGVFIHGIFLVRGRVSGPPFTR